MADQPINFIALRGALLEQIDTLVPRWLPAGHLKGNYWYVGDFQGSPGKSANVNMTTGGWGDNGSDESGRDLISLYACIHDLTNGEAARELMEQLGWKSADERGPVRRDAVQTSASPPAPKVTKKQARRVPIVPVPKHVLPPTLRFGYKDEKQGGAWVELEAVRSWKYEFEGELYGYVGRYERINSKGELVKDTITFTWCEDQEGRGRGTQRWHAKAWEDPRPLYVPAGLLSADCSLPVVIVEGEKCAEAGHQLLGHEFDFVSWPGGCATWAKARWGWIMGRTVILWPDCDAQRERLSKAEKDAGVDPLTKDVRPEDKQPGFQAMVQLGTHLQAAEGCSVSICRIPGPGIVPDGWDIADAIAEGWDAARVRDFLRGARTFVSPNDEARAKAANPPSDAGASDEEDSIAWRSKLIQASNGSIKPVRENIVLALDGQTLQGGRHLRGIPEAEGVIAFNEFTNNVEKLKPAPWKSRGKVWEEVEDLELGDWLSREHYLPSMSSQTLEEAVKMVAWRRRFHPVRERIEALRGTWDRQPRLKNWLRRACLVDGGKGIDEPTRKYLARAGTWFLMALVARVMTPGCKFDYMLIFEGGQGMGKSTLAELLGLGWFADTGLTLGDKDSYQNLQGILVYEWGELQNLSKAEVGKVKLFIASKKDWFRASFDKRPREYPRQVVFIGTTNESHYLTDQTGNRRFWPVRVTRFVDLAWLRENLDQLLAEALEKFEAGDRFHPTFEEQRDLFDPQQMERTVEDSLESEIRRLLYDEDQKVPHGGLNWALVSEVSIGQLMEAMGVSVDKRTQVLTKQVSSVMARLGWARARASGKAGESRPYVYRRPKDSPSAQAPDGPEDDDFGGPTQGQDDEGADDECPF